MLETTAKEFAHTIPAFRLGQRHESRASFFSSVYPSRKTGKKLPNKKRKEYALIIVTESLKRRILLGLKRRGFGAGFYNCFGGEIDSSHESAVDAAVHKLFEEINIQVPMSTMKMGSIGILNLSFQDDVDVEKVVHLFQVDVECSPILKGDGGNDIDLDDTQTYGVGAGKREAIRVDPTSIKGCDEITAEWFENWSDTPLNKMFADASIWLPEVLSAPVGTMKMNGLFHFHPGGTDVNSIMHYHVHSKVAKHNNSIETPPEARNKENSIERTLFHAIHASNVKSPTIKEFKECWAFANSVRSYFGKNSFDFVLDVAGGHGALAALFLILTQASKATVIDPAESWNGKEGIRNAWSPLFCNKTLEYRHECLRTALPDEISKLLSTGVKADRVLVVACHACQHLTEETMKIAESFGVHIAVMSCCQKDHSGRWKAVSKNAVRGGLELGLVMDLLSAGKMMAPSTGLVAGVRYEVKMKLIDKSITPQNRIVMCKSMRNEVHSSVDENHDSSNVHSKKVERAHLKLQKAYERAHRNSQTKPDSMPADANVIKYNQLCIKSATVGLCLGVLISMVVQRQRQ